MRLQKRLGILFTVISLAIQPLCVAVQANSSNGQHPILYFVPEDDSSRSYTVPLMDEDEVFLYLPPNRHSTFSAYASEPFAGSVQLELANGEIAPLEANCFVLGENLEFEMEYWVFVGDDGFYLLTILPLEEEPPLEGDAITIEPEEFPQREPVAYAPPNSTPSARFEVTLQNGGSAEVPLTASLEKGTAFTLEPVPHVLPLQTAQSVVATLRAGLAAGTYEDTLTIAAGELEWVYTLQQEVVPAEQQPPDSQQVQGSFGQITGTTAEMEYAQQEAGPYLPCLLGTTPLSSGSYWVRMAEKEGQYGPSTAIEVEVLPVAGGLVATPQPSDQEYHLENAPAYSADRKPLVVVLQNTGNTALEVSAQTSFGTAFSASPKDQTIAPGSTGTVSIFTKAQTPPGTYSGSVEIWEKGLSLQYHVVQSVGLGEQTLTQPLVGIAPNAPSDAGKIAGTTPQMEWRAAGSESYSACTEPETTVGTAGLYEVRLKAKDGFFASAPVTVLVPSAQQPTGTVSFSPKEDAVAPLLPATFAAEERNGLTIAVANSTSEPVNLLPVLQQNQKFSLFANPVVEPNSMGSIRVFLPRDTPVGEYSAQLVVAAGGTAHTYSVVQNVLHGSQQAPTTVVGQAEDGFWLQNTTEQMEFRPFGTNDTFVPCQSGKTPILAAGIYEVRLAATPNLLASPAAVVAIVQQPANTFMLYFHPNGGHSEPQPACLAVGESLLLPTEEAAPVRAGYHLLGWSLSSIGTELMQPGERFFLNQHADTTLYAIWQPVASSHLLAEHSPLWAEADEIPVVSAEFPDIALEKGSTELHVGHMDAALAVNQNSAVTIQTEAMEIRFPAGSMTELAGFLFDFGSTMDDTESWDARKLLAKTKNKHAMVHRAHSGKAFPASQPLEVVHDLGSWYRGKKMRVFRLNSSNQMVLLGEFLADGKGRVTLWQKRGGTYLFEPAELEES